MGNNKERIFADIMSMNPEVTGSCHFVNVRFPNNTNLRFIVDCGLFQEKEHEKLNEKLIFDPEQIDFCLVTHNHIDHIGRLPLMLRKKYSKEIYTTEDTSKLMPYALGDTVYILKNISKRKGVKCIYNEQNVDDVFKLVKPCKYAETLQVREDVKVTFFTNGHLIGAAMILVQISFPGCDDINLLFTGDYNNKNVFFKVSQLPDWVLKLPLTIILESTYGDMDSNDIEEVFWRNVIDWTRKDGTVLCPVFSLGRAQEILYELKLMQEENLLDKDIPIYLDGKLAIKYTEMYLRGALNIKPEMRDFLPQHFNYVNKITRNSILFGKEQKILLTTSGMGSYGPAQLYIPEYIKRRNTLIHFTGYTSEGTLGRRLKDAELNDVVEVGGILLQKSSRVEYTSEYSAHAKANEMISELKKFQNVKLILLNHGEYETVNTFSKRIMSEVEPKNIGVLGRKYSFRVNPYGLVKTLPINFQV